MPVSSNRAVAVPLGQIVAVDQYSRQLVSELSDVRLALGALGNEISNHSRDAFLRLIEGQLNRIEKKAECELGKIPQWLLRQI